MTIEGSVANVTLVVFPDRAEHEILGIMFDFLLSNQSDVRGRGVTVL